jgi:acetyl esterase/lipase
MIASARAFVLNCSAAALVSRIKKIDRQTIMKLILSVLLVTLSVVLVMNADTQTHLSLWPDGAPGALGKSEKDNPTITPYLPDPARATGAALIICPGGGYGGLAPYEGHDYALWLNEMGIAGFVLKYRLGSSGYHHPAMLQDVSRAIRYVRANASEWKLDPKRVGVMGSSAGGHLAATVMTHFEAGKPDATDPIERQSSRPDIGILCYPVISMDDKLTHAGSKKNLLGDNPDPELVKELSNELQVTKDTPPTFIFHTVEDNAVKVENSMAFAEALRKNHVPFSMHLYQKGRHGIALGVRLQDPGPRHPWTADCAFWLREQGFAK